MPPKKKNVSDRAEQELAFLAGTSEAARLARYLLAVPERSAWGGYQYCPPGSLLEITVKEFDLKTHAPLELPLFITLEMLSAILLRKEVRIRISGVKKPLEVFIWAMLLAGSGSLKSLTLSSIADTVADAGCRELLWELSGISGPAAFMQEFAGSGECPGMNRRLCVIEEVGQFRKKMRDGGPLEELKNYFIQIYDGTKVLRTTKSGKLEVENPAISLFGISVAEVFLEEVRPEDMVSGEMQRQAIILCESFDVDSRRHSIMKINLAKTKKEWKKLIQSIIHREYLVNAKTSKLFDEIYKRLVAKFSKDVPDSFLLRIMWSFHRYAVLYHIFLGKGREQAICKEGYLYAERIIERILSDMARTFRMTLSSETYKKLRQIESWKERHGRLPTVREAYRNFRNINPREAEYLLALIQEPQEFSA